MKSKIGAMAICAVMLSGAGLFVGARVKAQDKAAAAPVAPVLKIDHNHSTIAFEVPILGGLSRVPGKFTDFDITTVYDPADMTKSQVSATIRVASIDTGIADRDKDLRSAGFFDAEKFPTITFVSHSIEKIADGFVAHGTLTIKGVAKEVELPFRIAGEFPLPTRKVVGFHAQMKLNRRDYGINWEHNAIATFVGDEVEVVLDILG